MEEHSNPDRGDAFRLQTGRSGFSIVAMTPDERARLFLRLARYFGTEVGAEFMRRTGAEHPELGVECLHSLSEGIFKPADSPYALTVWSRSAAGADHEIYEDVIHARPDGGWSMAYAAKSGSLEGAINRSLFACLRDRQPVLVMVTSRPKGSPGGARYRLLGPAFIEGFDPAARRFQLTGCVPALATALAAVATPEEQEEAYLRQRLALPLAVGEARAEYVVSRLARDAAFRELVLAEYHHFCCVCKSRFILREGAGALVEAEAAHIRPVAARGPDDLRNALALCKRHHWAFDAGLFAVTDTLEVRVSPAVQRAVRERFDLEEYGGEGILRPHSEACVPDGEMLHWHRRHVFRS